MSTLHNLHISLTNIKNEARLFKQTKSLIKNNMFDKIDVVGLHEERLKLNENLESNIFLHRIKLKSRDLPKNLIIQLIKYFEFLFIILFKFKKYNVVTIHSLGLLPIGVLYKLLYRSKLIYDAHEYETETKGLYGIRKKLAKFLEKTLIKYCDKVFVVSESIAREYKKLYPIMPLPSLVLNTPEYSEIKKQNIFRETFNINKDQTIFLYQGGLSGGRGIEILLETFKQLSQKQENINYPVIVFMGYGPLSNVIRETANNFNNIFLHNAVSPDVLLNYTSSADFGILFYENNCLNHYYCSPNKIFEYIMAEIPVIVSNLYEMKRLVEKNQIGVVAKENTSQGLKEAIQKAVKLDKEELNKNLQIVKKIYNWQEQEKILIKEYNAI